MQATEPNQFLFHPVGSFRLPLDSRDDYHHRYFEEKTKLMFSEENQEGMCVCRAGLPKGVRTGAGAQGRYTLANGLATPQLAQLLDRPGHGQSHLQGMPQGH